MRKHKFMLYLIRIVVILLLMNTAIFFMIGEVTIKVKDAGSERYIPNVNIYMKPDLKGTAGPGTDAAGPFRFELNMPARTDIRIGAKGYKDKSLNLTLIPFKTYTIYLEPSL